MRYSESKDFYKIMLNITIYNIYIIILIFILFYLYLYNNI